MFSNKPCIYSQTQSTSEKKNKTNNPHSFGGLFLNVSLAESLSELPNLARTLRT